MPRGYRGSGLDWLHVTIWCKPAEWDKIQYDWASSGKQTVSQYVIDKLLNYGEKPVEKCKKIKEKGSVRPLCVPKDKWDIIKQRAIDNNLKVSQYVIAVLMS